MNMIKLNHWFINDNELAISLLHYYVSIKIYSENNNIYYIVQVADTNNEIEFKFSTLENAITFTESIVAYCSNFAEVRDKYLIFRDHQEKTYKKER